MEDGHFVDAVGRHWESRVTANVILRLQTETGISLFRIIANAAEKVQVATDETAKALAEAAASRAFADFFSEGPNLAAILFLSVERQARERRITKDQLLDSLETQEHLNDAINAVKVAVTNFFQPPDAPPAEDAAAGVPGV